MHQGDETTRGRPDACNIDGRRGRPTIAKKVTPEVDAIFTGHSHQQYNCVVDRSGRATRAR